MLSVVQNENTSLVNAALVSNTIPAHVCFYFIYFFPAPLICSFFQGEKRIGLISDFHFSSLLSMLIRAQFFAGKGQLFWLRRLEWYEDMSCLPGITRFPPSPFTWFDLLFLPYGCWFLVPQHHMLFFASTFIHIFFFVHHDGEVFSSEATSPPGTCHLINLEWKGRIRCWWGFFSRVSGGSSSKKT